MTLAPTRSRAAAWTWLAIAAALLVAALAVTFLNLRSYLTVPEVRLPEVVGMRHDEAASVLRRMGLEPVTFVENVSTAAPDAVTSQAPLPGASVKRGRTVHLGVNAAAAAARVPDLMGMREAEARERARELNLPLAATEYQPSEAAAGTVVGQTPEGGAQLAAGQGVSLTVSKGRELATAEIPSLVGVPVDEAVRRLQGLGFGRVERVASSVSFTQAGDVVSTFPAAGSRVVTSTPVVVNYALSARNVVEVPDLLGLPQWRAQLALRGAQLQLGPVRYVQDPDRPQGVVEVQPTGYTLPGTPVLLTINGDPVADPIAPSFGLPGFGDDLGQGEAGVTPGVPGGVSGQPPAPSQGAAGVRTIPFTFDPTFMGVRRLLEEPYRLELVVNDELGVRTVFDETLDAGEVVTTTVEVHGPEALLQTFIDGVFFQAWRP